MTPPDDEISTLLRRAQAAFDALTPDEQIHHRHLQRVSFAVGNVGLSRPDVPRTDLERLAAEAAGPCPCGRCSPTLVAANRPVDADSRCPGEHAGPIHVYVPGSERCLCGAHPAPRPDLSCPTCGAPGVMNPPGVTPRLRVEHRAHQACGAMCSSTPGWPGITHPKTCGCVGGAAR